ncbi:MAG: hypothetical protein KDK54_15265 [Leptospiraceae bacterium]|nr:hypothetical protein [Leptospiraceae bacterium]
MSEVFVFKKRIHFSEESPQTFKESLKNSPSTLRAKGEDNEREPFGKLGTHRPKPLFLLIY